MSLTPDDLQAIRERAENATYHGGLEQVLADDIRALLDHIAALTAGEARLLGDIDRTHRRLQTILTHEPHAEYCANPDAVCKCWKAEIRDILPKPKPPPRIPYLDAN